ncbi:MAG: enoyl-CoA hydratase, partial [Burkholderiales bacterium]|nr:enoyl-CoA hydratase [Burkholderiales bacterium]
LESLLELSADLQSIAHKTDDHREAVHAFLEKRKPNFQ